MRRTFIASFVGLVAILLVIGLAASRSSNSQRRRAADSTAHKDSTAGKRDSVPYDPPCMASHIGLPCDK